MRSYKIVSITIKKSKDTIDRILNKLEGLRHNRIFFEICGIDKKNNCWDDLTEYAHRADFYVAVDSEISEPTYSECVLSNLDENWEHCNKNKNGSITKDILRKVLLSIKKARTTDYGTYFIGFDEIDWTGGTVSKGTYGYQKARSFHLFGDNYLSNSIIVAEDTLRKRFIVRVAFEEKYECSTQLQTIINSIAELGKSDGGIVYYAPETAEERLEWTERYTVAENKFSEVLSGIEKMMKSFPPEVKYLNYYEQCMPGNMNIMKHAKQHLCARGWVKTKSEPDKPGTCFVKKSEDATVILRVCSLERGHDLRTQLIYKSYCFYFCDRYKYNSFLPREEDVETYFEYLAKIADYAEEKLLVNEIN